MGKLTNFMSFFTLQNKYCFRVTPSSEAIAQRLAKLQNLLLGWENFAVRFTTSPKAFK